VQGAVVPHGINVRELTSLGDSCEAAVLYTARVNRYVISYRSRAAKPESDWREKRGQIAEAGVCVLILKPVSYDERYAGAQVFQGPLEDVGFADRTDVLHQEGIYKQINRRHFLMLARASLDRLPCHRSSGPPGGPSISISSIELVSP
jgi:hypothetical protein